MEHILLGVERKITDDMNQKLLAKYSTDLKGMGPTKTIGNDSFPAIFY